MEILNELIFRLRLFFRSTKKKYNKYQFRKGYFTAMDMLKDSDPTCILKAIEINNLKDTNAYHYSKGVEKAWFDFMKKQGVKNMYFQYDKDH